MIEYLIKSGLILIILLAIYHIWLEREKMYHFNRFFLLCSLCFGLAIPLMSLNIPPTTNAAFEVSPLIPQLLSPLLTNQELEDQLYVPMPGQNFWIIVIYGLVAGSLFVRFIVNLIQVGLKAQRNPKEKNAKGTIVLLKEEVSA